MNHMFAGFVLVFLLTRDVSAQCDMDFFSGLGCSVPRGMQECRPQLDHIDMSHCDTYIVGRNASVVAIDVTPPRKGLVLEHGAVLSVGTKLSIAGPLLLEEGSSLTAREGIELSGGSLSVAAHATLQCLSNMCAIDVYASDVSIDGLVRCGACRIRSLNNLTVSKGSAVDGDGLGHAEGGHATSSPRCYRPTLDLDDERMPMTFGAGTSCADVREQSSGGGAIFLEACGALDVHGAVRANGVGARSGYGGGGSGGSVLLVGGAVRGNGQLEAKGGCWKMKGGGGGRVAVHFGTLGEPMPTLEVESGCKWNGGNGHYAAYQLPSDHIPPPSYAIPPNMSHYVCASSKGSTEL